MKLAAVPSREEAAVDLGDDIEIIETGDPYQIVFTAQRRLIPTHATISNLAELEKEYNRWVKYADGRPHADVHLNRFYSQAKLPRLTEVRYLNGWETLP
jgi:hypothetical protein